MVCRTVCLALRDGQNGPEGLHPRGRNPDRALGAEPNDLTQRADRQRADSASKRVQTKQRAADRSHDHQSTSEPTNQPRPRTQRGRHGPERAAG